MKFSFGIISPKTKSDKTTIPILIKLLLIKIVANKVRGISLSLIIRSDVLLFSCFRSSISLGDKEKNATSDPEIKAEHNSKIMIRIAAPLTFNNGKSASKKEELKREAKNVPGMESNCFIF